MSNLTTRILYWKKKEENIPHLPLQILETYLPNAFTFETDDSTDKSQAKNNKYSNVLNLIRQSANWILFVFWYL